MNNYFIRNRILVITFVIYYLCIGRLVQLLSLTEQFVNLANALDFTVKHLVNYLTIFLYIIQFALLVKLFKNDINNKTIYSAKQINRNDNHRIVFTIILFSFFAFIVSSFGIKPGTIYSNHIIGNIVFFILIVICAPIVEELFFRVIIINHLIAFSKYNIKKIIIIQAIIFYLPHLIGGNYTFYTFYLGIISGILYYYTSSIIYSFILHMLANFSFFILTQNLIPYRLSYKPFSWLFFFLIICIIFYIILQKIISTSITSNTNLNIQREDINIA